ncbi:MAG: alanyl-tRNA editing protein [Chloroflexi bacterium]|nr:MAG: alanyl-tRNA editing protein [Chloroflexota bacterium]
MTELLYQTNSYTKTFRAVVTGVDEDNKGVILDQTAFYPGGGGQPYDTGILKVDGKKFRVTRSRKTGNDVVHMLEGSPLPDPSAASQGPVDPEIRRNIPEPGTVVEGEVDWDRRYRLMRTHTAMHILCGVIFRDYGASVTGGDMDPLQGRMDFEFETMHKDLVQTIEEAINKEVENAREVRVKILPREEAFQIPDLIRTKINLLPEGIQQVRVVEIVGLDLQADGGTHVQNTSEVGRIRVVDYKSKGKINKRIYVELDER